MLVQWGGPTFSTAINKRPPEGSVRIGRLGVEGDHQAHRDVHGGPEQALCVYPHEHYPRVAAFLGRELAIPSFGENVTTQGLLEEEVCIGDIYRIGSARVQVSQPRQPCNTLARKHGRPDLIEWIISTGRCGFYLRVLDEGEASAGDAIELLERLHGELTVVRAMHTMFCSHRQPGEAQLFAACHELSPGWRRRMARRA
jgi:MOSC domain-containing protein YiiM